MYINSRKFQEFYVSVRMLLSSLFCFFILAFLGIIFQRQLLRIAAIYEYENNTNFLYNWKNECTMRVLAPLFHVRKIFCQPSSFIQAFTFIREVRWNKMKSFERRLQFPNWLGISKWSSLVLKELCTSLNLIWNLETLSSFH